MEQHYPAFVEHLAETAALLADEVLPALPLRQWVISIPFALRFLLASRPDALARALEVVYRLLATHLARKAGFTRTQVATGAVTLIPRFDSALNLDIHLHLHLLCLDGVYTLRPDEGQRTWWTWRVGFGREGLYPSCGYRAVRIREIADALTVYSP